MDRRLLGALGESMAAADYRKDGYEMVAANYRTRQGEVDLIVRKEKLYVFAEVKTRSPGAIAAPRESVTRHKRQRILLAARMFLSERELGDVPVRLDVVEVLADGDGGFSVHRLENAFEENG